MAYDSQEVGITLFLLKLLEQSSSYRELPFHPPNFWNSWEEGFYRCASSRIFAIIYFLLSYCTILVLECYLGLGNLTADSSLLIICYVVEYLGTANVQRHFGRTQRVVIVVHQFHV